MAAEILKHGKQDTLVGSFTLVLHPSKEMQNFLDCVEDKNEEDVKEGLWNQEG